MYRLNCLVNLILIQFFIDEMVAFSNVSGYADLPC